MTTHYCPDCGNFDCPRVSADPYFRRCPATDRVTRERTEWAEAERVQCEVDAIDRGHRPYDH